LCSIFVCVLITMLPAQVKFSGMTQSSIYTWENINENQLVDFYQHFNAKVYAENFSDLYFKTYFRVGRNGDPAEWNEKVHNAYFNWISPCRKLEARLGRQFIYSGVMNGTVDALVLKAKPVENSQIQLVAGMDAPFDRALELLKWDEGNVLGASGSYGLSDAAKLKLSYYQKSRSSEVFWQLAGGSLSGNLFKSLYYQAEYDHNLKTSEFQAMRFRLNYIMNKWMFFAEYNSQKPRIYEDSFFQIFEQTAFNQVRSGITYQLGKYNIGLQDVYTAYEESESANQVHLTASGSFGMIGLLYQSGYAGENTGVYGSVHYNLMKALLLRVTSSYYRYERQTTAISEDATAFSASLAYKFSPMLQVKAEVQERINSYYNNDVRGLFRLQYAFNN
ncbi:MAG: hypothetical protein P8X42_16465, partial [Calditrichaceae bacterium]